MNHRPKTLVGASGASGAVEVGATRRMIDRARSLEWGSLPSDVVVHARHCFLDWVGVTLAGTHEPVAELVCRWTPSPGSGAAGATALGRGRLDPRDATMVNGVAGHALDFDDVNVETSGHVTAVVAPAALAAAERADACGDRLLTAFVAGYELTGDLAVAIGPGHYDRGFHATATFGTFGAAAAVSHLEGLDPDSWQSALGLAGTTAAGLKSMFGTMGKPFHAGWAAQSGLVAADLAALGVTAAPDVVERVQGFAQSHGDTLDPSGIASRWHLRSNVFKFHAACFLTHSSIDSARLLRDERGFEPADVESITVRVHPGHLRICNIEAPTTGAESKFSLRYAIAAALTPGLDLWTAFTDEAVATGRLRALQSRVRVVPSEDLPRDRSEVRVTTRDGRELVQALHATRELDAPDLGAREERLSTKFRSLVDPVLGAGRAEELRQLILATDESTQIADITRLTRPAETDPTSERRQ